MRLHAAAGRRRRAAAAPRRCQQQQQQQPPLPAASRPGLEESAADRIEERRAFRFDITTLQPSAAAEWRAAPAAEGPKRG